MFGGDAGAEAKEKKTKPLRIKGRTKFLIKSALKSVGKPAETAGEKGEQNLSCSRAPTSYFAPNSRYRQERAAAMRWDKLITRFRRENVEHFSIFIAGQT